MRLGEGEEAAKALGRQPPLVRVCWIVEEFLGLSRGSVVKRFVLPRAKPRDQHTLSLVLPLDDVERPLHETAGKLFRDTLNRVLSDRHLGKAELLSSTLGRAAGGRSVVVKDEFLVVIKGELNQGGRLLQQLLYWLRAPASAQLRTLACKDEIPLWVRSDGGDQELSLHLGRLEVAHFELFGEEGYRLDHVPLDAEARRALRTVLVDVGADGPDDDGWFAVHLADGGSLRVCFRGLGEDSDLDGGTVLISRLSYEAAHVVHRLLSAGRMLLLPMGIATSEAEVRAVAAPWPPVRIVESAAELHSILICGARGWWLTAGRS